LRARRKEQLLLEEEEIPVQVDGELLELLHLLVERAELGRRPGALVDGELRRGLARLLRGRLPAAEREQRGEGRVHERTGGPRVAFAAPVKPARRFRSPVHSMLLLIHAHSSRSSVRTRSSVRKSSRAPPSNTSRTAPVRSISTSVGSLPTSYRRPASPRASISTGKSAATRDATLSAPRRSLSRLTARSTRPASR